MVNLGEVLKSDVSPTSKGIATEEAVSMPLIRGVENTSNTKDDDESTDEYMPETVSLLTSQGDIIINLRPDLALESVLYIKSLLDSPTPCKRCRFYRAEQKGILQGILKKDGITPNEVLGSCPNNVIVEKGEKCHGPEMTRGMVGWAAGEGGPDFFIDNYKRPADWWGHEHTVWGEITDEESLEVVNSFFDLPAHKETLTFLDNPVHIDLR